MKEILRFKKRLPFGVKMSKTFELQSADIILVDYRVGTIWLRGVSEDGTEISATDVSNHNAYIHDSRNAMMINSGEYYFMAEGRCAVRVLRGIS